MSWYLEAWKKYAVFQGRARRKEYFYTILFHIIFMFLFLGIDYVLGTLGENTGFFTALYGLAFMLPTLGLIVRRLHDTGRSGWWYFILFIPIIGAIVFMVFIFQDSELDENQYGPNPKMASAY